MLEDEIYVFIDCLDHYFLKKSDQKVIIETPYLTESIAEKIMDFTGSISISGHYLGSVFFTASNEFIEKLIKAHNQSDLSLQLKRDVIGEVINTLSGNSRKTLGSHFVISVPKVLESHEIGSEGCEYAYVIPVKWYGHNAAMIINITKR